jgi:hypothetical protein
MNRYQWSKHAVLAALVLRRKMFLGEKGSWEKDPRRNSFLGQVSQEQFLPGMLFLAP